MKRSAVLLLAAGALFLAPAAPAQLKKPLTLDAIYAEPPVVSLGMSNVAWRDATHFTFTLAEGSGPDARPALWQIDATTGKRAKLLEPVPVPPAGGGGGAKETAKDAKPKTLPFAGSVWNAAGTALLLQGENDLWLYNFAAKALRRLTRDEDEEEYPVFSPDGARVAYVKKNDLWVVDVAKSVETRLTKSDGPEILYGKLDWVYEEELAHRRSGRAFEWAPDSSAIAYLRLDDSKVPTFPLVDYLPTNGKLVPQRYPKAGDPNPTVIVQIVDLAGTILNGLQPTADDYVSPELSWTPDSKGVAAVVMDRNQREVFAQLLPKCQEDSAFGRILAGIRDPAWINSIEPPTFLRDGSGFLLPAESSGFLHLYRWVNEGRDVTALTSGSWMVDDAWELDEKNGWVYFLATQKDPRQRHVYRVKLDGTSLTRLSPGDGFHSLKLAPGGAYYLDTFSDATTPPRTALHRADGTRVAFVDEPKNRLAEFALGSVELGSFTGSDGTLFYTRLVKPPDFDPGKRYPVVVYVYGGPHAQVVQDRWGSNALLDQVFAQRGYLVFSMDGRGSWGRGHAFESPLLKKLGETELKDQLAGVEHLKKMPFVDGDRIGIWGWSYGGYMTLYAATHAGETFRCAVAGAPVADWKYYDSIYTERYMGTPKENPDGYKAASPLEAAARLGTRLLLIHGTSDDNVHMQNTMAFVDALVKAGKDFTFVPLPGQKHGPRDKAIRRYYQRRILEFFEKNL